MPWTTIGSEDCLGGVRDVFVDDNGFVIEGAHKDTIMDGDNGGWGESWVDVVVDEDGDIVG